MQVKALMQRRIMEPPVGQGSSVAGEVELVIVEGGDATPR
jgi:hypothetical protein